MWVAASWTCRKFCSPLVDARLLIVPPTLWGCRMLRMRPCPRQLGAMWVALGKVRWHLESLIGRAVILISNCCGGVDCFLPMRPDADENQYGWYPTHW